jgi:beta-glucanase (GH16 family)
LTSASDYGGQAYSSARLITQAKRQFTYGFFEVRAKMPCGQGTWPAIWTLGSSGTWPAQGEIDIMEHVGSKPTVVQSAIHTSNRNGGSAPVGTISVPDACTAFHNYQLLWTPDELRFYVDGVHYHTYLNDKTGKSSWPFDDPQFLLLNLAIGGTLGGTVDDNIFPRTFSIDYVRVYQKP